MADAGLLYGLAKFGEGFLGGMERAEKAKREREDSDLKRLLTQGKLSQLGKLTPGEQAGLAKSGLMGSMDQEGVLHTERTPVLPIVGGLTNEQNVGFKQEAIDAKNKQLEESTRHNKATEGLTKEKINKKGSKDSLTLVPGYVLDPTIKPPSSKDLSDLKTSVSEAKTLGESIDKLKELVSSASVKELANPFSAKRRSIDQFVTNTQMFSKGEGLYKLGVLNGQDLNVLKAIIQDPTSVKSLAENFIYGPEQGNQRFSDFKDIINSRLENRMSAQGFSRSGGGKKSGGSKADRLRMLLK